MQHPNNLFIKIFLVSLFFLFSTINFQSQPVENVTHIGVMNFYMTDRGEYYLEYRGQFPPCFAAELAKFLLKCDTFNIQSYLEESFPVDTLPPSESDSLSIDSNKVKTIRI